MENRSAARSNVFLTATLHAGSAGMSVRIRNLSTNGALVEGSSLPPPGSRIRLVRGDLNVDGELVWQNAPYGGINFSCDIDVAQWVPGKGHAGQHQVDRLIAAVRQAEEAPIEPHCPLPSESLQTLSAALDECCERLANMPPVSIEFAEEVLRLESIAQALRKQSAG